GLDYRAAARAGLLHDLFLYDWHQHPSVTGARFHGFSHPAEALKNAEKAFALNDMEKEIILKHMWPLTLNPPRYKEAFVVLYHDKVCSFRETMGKPVF
ncbi:MAG: HD family phosphohydrolase, partial [Oscillospiraceae bacterium]